MEFHRQLLNSHRWVIQTAIKGKVSAANIDSFIRYGEAQAGSPEVIPTKVWEKVAEFHRTGVLRWGD